MRVYLAGAAGAIGRQLVPILVAAGHAVVGTTRSPDRAGWLTSVGAEPAIVDAYDADALRASVIAARPEVVIHELSDLAGGFAPAELAKTARLREVGTRHLLGAATAAGARRLVAQSGAWLYADGPLPHLESHPLRSPAGPDDATVRGVALMEEMLTGAAALEVLILRYGLLYGPGTAADAGDAMPEPRVSVEGAARATALAVDHGAPGIYNVVDDNAVVSNARARELLGWGP